MAAISHPWASAISIQKEFPAVISCFLVTIFSVSIGVEEFEWEMDFFIFLNFSLDYPSWTVEDSLQASIQKQSNWSTLLTIIISFLDHKVCCLILYILFVPFRFRKKIYFFKISDMEKDGQSLFIITILSIPGSDERIL